MKTNDINDFKSRLKDAMLSWAEDKIDALFPEKTQTRAIMKNGLNNMMSRIDNSINSYVDNIVLFIGDAEGNLDGDAMVDMAVKMFNEMDNGEYRLGSFNMRVGKGELILYLPHNIFLEMLVGNLGSVRFTSEDLKQFKNFLI